MKKSEQIYQFFEFTLYGFYYPLAKRKNRRRLIDLGFSFSVAKGLYESSGDYQITALPAGWILGKKVWADDSTFSCSITDCEGNERARLQMQDGKKHYRLLPYVTNCVLKQMRLCLTG